MDVTNIISEIDLQIAKLQQARTLLMGNRTPKPSRGRLKKVVTATAAAVPAAVAKVTGTGRKKRNLSADARKRIADAQKKRWAERRKQA